MLQISFRDSFIYSSTSFFKFCSRVFIKDSTIPWNYYNMKYKSNKSTKYLFIYLPYSSLWQFSQLYEHRKTCPEESQN